MRPDDEQLTRAVECALMGHNRRLIDHMAPRERRFDETISHVIRCSAPCRVPRWSERAAQLQQLSTWTGAMQPGRRVGRIAAVHYRSYSPRGASVHPTCT